MRTYHPHLASNARALTHFSGAAIVGILGALIVAPTTEAKTLRIENKRVVALESLIITAKDGSQSRIFILAENIAPGSAATRPVPSAHCLFDVKGVFADQSTLAAEDMNLCAQKTIRLVE